MNGTTISLPNDILAILASSSVFICNRTNIFLKKNFFQLYHRNKATGAKIIHNLIAPYTNRPNITTRKKSLTEITFSLILSTINKNKQGNQDIQKRPLNDYQK